MLQSGDAGQREPWSVAHFSGKQTRPLRVSIITKKAAIPASPSDSICVRSTINMNIIMIKVYDTNLCVYNNSG